MIEYLPSLIIHALQLNELILSSFISCFVNLYIYYNLCDELILSSFIFCFFNLFAYYNLCVRRFLLCLVVKYVHMFILPHLMNTNTPETQERQEEDTTRDAMEIGYQFQVTKEHQKLYNLQIDRSILPEDPVSRSNITEFELT